jgi:hypothetical protein
MEPAVMQRARRVGEPPRGWARRSLIQASGSPCWVVAVVTVSGLFIGAPVGGFEPIAEYLRDVC